MLMVALALDYAACAKMRLHAAAPQPDNGGTRL